MSVFNDFQQVWLQRFPDNPLPGAWEEHIKMNLAKHKQKVMMFKEEVRKEEIYVEYLERLLSDIQRHKINGSGDADSEPQQQQGTMNETGCSSDVTGDKLSNTCVDASISGATTTPNITSSSGAACAAVATVTSPLNLDELESMTANMCVTEISNELSKLSGSNSVATTVIAGGAGGERRSSNTSNSELLATAPAAVIGGGGGGNTVADPSPFVTVIEVNGVKSLSSSTMSSVNRSSSNASSDGVISRSPPKLPTKPSFYRENSMQKKLEHRESIGSSCERVSTPDEPYYDIVAPEEPEFSLLESDNSSAENTLSSTASFLPKHEKGSQSPGASNYVNIEYFIQSAIQNEHGHSSSDEDVTDIRHRVSNGSYASSSSLDSSTPSTRRKFVRTDSESEGSEKSMYKCILYNIIDSETDYVEWLSVLIKYMKAIQATVTTSQPIATETELNTIFYKIPELYSLHSSFLDSLRDHTEKWESGKIGECFKQMALNLELYGAFLGNYGRAVDTVRKCCETNSQFNSITKNITCKHLSRQPINLEDILHKPVARVQKNALVLHDLLKCVPPTSHTDHNSLTEALQLTQNFLDQFNMIQTKSMFPVPDRAQRRLVKNSFIVEFADGHRKLRHLFLFNDVIACAKYKSSGRTEKYTFELKWFIPVEDICILEESTANFHESSATNIVSLKSQASNVRDQLRQEEKALEDKKIRSSRGSDKFKKRLVELESQLVLVSPNLPFRIKNRQTGRTYIFFLSSEFERHQWIEAIHTLQRAGKPPPPAPHSSQQFSMFELQTWITACRAFLKTNMGSYLLRSGQDESLLVGDLLVHICELTGLEYNCELYIVLEVDFYGHFFQKAKTKPVASSNVFQFSEHFVIDLEGCENLRVLIYRTQNNNSTTNQTSPSHDALLGKFTQKLSRQWLRQQEAVEKKLTINGNVLRLNLKFTPCEVSLRRIPTGKTGALFGEKIQQVCKRQKRDIPFIVTACIREVERRGMSEVGLYRVSGSASDISKLKKSFETNSYEAEQLLKEVDIHSVTGILKLYLRELPEALFTDQLYSSLLEAFNRSNGNYTRRIELLKECFAKLPQQNKATINFILDHLIKVHKHEDENKMSMHNLATVFGPTLLRPGGKPDDKHKATLATGTVDVMAQAGILYCFLQDLNNPNKK